MSISTTDARKCQVDFMAEIGHLQIDEGKVVYPSGGMD